jgi:hypothetical protein
MLELARHRRIRRLLEPEQANFNEFAGAVLGLPRRHWSPKRLLLCLGPAPGCSPRGRVAALLAGVLLLLRGAPPAGRLVASARAAGWLR